MIITKEQQAMLVRVWNGIVKNKEDFTSGDYHEYHELMLDILNQKTPDNYVERKSD